MQIKTPILVSIGALAVLTEVLRIYLRVLVIDPKLAKDGVAVKPWPAGIGREAADAFVRISGGGPWATMPLTLYLLCIPVEILLLVAWICIAIWRPGRVF